MLLLYMLALMFLWYVYIGLGGHVISDGGCTCPGDFSKAFGAGADFVCYLSYTFILLYYASCFTPRSI